MNNDMLKYFGYKHLPETLQAVSKPFHDLAVEILKLPEGSQRDMSLVKLLEAKDCAVRTMIK